MRCLIASLCILSVVCVTTLCATVNFEDFYDLDDFSKHCGTHAVLVCLAEQGLGGLESFGAVDAFLDFDEDGNTSFLHVVECLDAYGVKATGYRGALTDLSSGGRFILQIKLREQPHFSYAQIDTESGEVSLYDPALGSKILTVSLRELGKVWSGNFIEVGALKQGSAVGLPQAPQSFKSN
jgi:hypothetical protein